jgi:hypothetical protein
VKFRLHIDIPLPFDEITAAKITQEIVDTMVASTASFLQMAGIKEFNYRLGHDEDRQKSNYLVKTPSGHVVNKKSRVSIGETDV